MLAGPAWFHCIVAGMACALLMLGVWGDHVLQFGPVHTTWTMCLPRGNWHDHLDRALRVERLLHPVVDTPLGEGLGSEARTWTCGGETAGGACQRDAHRPPGDETCPIRPVKGTNGATNCRIRSWSTVSVRDGPLPGPFRRGTSVAEGAVVVSTPARRNAQTSRERLE